MSAPRARININVKDGTLEIEGSEDFVKEMTKEYKDIFSTSQPKVRQQKPSKDRTEPKDKKSRRGGQRLSVISPAIDKLIDDGWLDDFKTVAEVVTELTRLTVPGVNRVNVGMALGRRVPDKLDRIRTSDKKWTYKKK